MTTLNVDNVIKNTGFALRTIEYPLDTTGSHDFHQGDLLYQDQTSWNVYAADTDAHCTYFVGVALIPSFVAPYTYAPGGTVQKFYSPSAVVGIGCLVYLKTTAGDTYTDDLAVYIGADAQTITAVAASHSVGVAKMPKGYTSIAGGTGVKIPVLLTISKPIASL